MSFRFLKDFIYRRKDHIVREMLRRLAQLPRSRYQEFVMTDEGRRRVKMWVDLVIGSLEGKRESFFVDQKQVGYSRALNGFEFEFPFEFYLSFLQTLRELLRREAHEEKLRPRHLHEEIQELNEILFQGYSVAAASWLKTREEQITEKMTQLQELYLFTHEIMTTFDLEKIVHLILRKMISLFGVEESILSVCKDRHIQTIYTYPTKQDPHKIRPIVEETLREDTSLFVNEGGDTCKEMDEFKLKRVVSVPIQARSRCYGVLALYNRTRSFEFTKKELDLLHQFLYITAGAFENAFMLKEIERGRQELHFLAGKMISIQEEERRRLAADIHDTVAQALTGISYKIQFCRGLLGKDPELLPEQFDSLMKSIYHAIDQSRELISSLRPDLIDTMGLVPALQRHIDNFKKETGLRVTAKLQKKVQLCSEANICLFRVAQEALVNVYKHAEATNVEIFLEQQDGNVVLVVADNGKGFDMSTETPWLKDQKKLGLLSMKERVEAVGGILAINAEINRGCRIDVKLPLNIEVSHSEED